jgi:flagellar biosynthesis protein FlhG
MIRVTSTAAGRPVPGPRVWAIGGGKGGIGKSVIAANLAVILAQRGFRVVLIDVDLGGANLHTILGVSGKGPTLTDFLHRRSERLAEIMVPTRTAGLSLISGHRAPVDSANPKHAQKARLLRQIAALPADHVVLDLGAGSGFNVIDFFLAAENGVVVVIPEATSVENAYQFLKAAYFRKLRRAQPRERVRQAMAAAMAHLDALGIRSPRELVLRVRDTDPVAAEGLLREARGFDPAIIINRVQRPEHRQLGLDMGLALEDYFGRRVRFLGTLDEDEMIAHSVRERRPAADRFPDCRFVGALQEVVNRMVAGREVVRGA